MSTIQSDGFELVEETVGTVHLPAD